MCGGPGHREERTERDAYQGNALGVDERVSRDMLHGGFEGIEPERDVDAIADGGEVRANGAGAIEVVRREEENAGFGEGGLETAEPEADVAARAVEQDESRALAGGAGWRAEEFEAYLLAAGEKALLHARRDALGATMEAAGKAVCWARCSYAPSADRYMW